MSEEEKEVQFISVVNAELGYHDAVLWSRLLNLVPEYRDLLKEHFSDKELDTLNDMGRQFRKEL